MPSVLISGANKGLGLATARLLGRKGFHIWLGSRSAAAGLATEAKLRAEGLNVISLQLDVTDKDSIAATASRIMAEGSLDILINNAAIMDEGVPPGQPAGPPSAVPLDALQRSYATNLFGPVRLIQAMLPLLLHAPSGRIVNVSSRLGSFGHQTDPDWPGRAVNKLSYSSSKAALNMATVLFAYELRHTSIKVNAVSPGIIATDLNGEGASVLHGRPGYGAPEEGARLVVDCALMPDDGPSGKFFGPGGELPW
ncbi:MAG: SDR family NAD(P)-dependent oxidoreductase [Alphaproteobacteria bacterium]|nr:SDR family NAD(P)-dependent oxidoreductase [Alphaproteobacteria bacterium]